MEKLKKYKGITLISLVITIIVLLILAGITISQLTGNGLFEKAKLAKEASKNAQEDEDGKIKQYSNEIDEYIDSDRAFSIKDLELDYDNKVDIKGKTASNNSYTVPSAGIVAVSAHSTQRSVISIYINSIYYPIVGEELLEIMNVDHIVK